MAAILALCSSLLWGTGDFLGGRASRGFQVLRVLFWSQLATFLVLWGVVGMLVAADVLELAIRNLLIGAAGGFAGVVALACFYRALAIGPMSVVPPIAAAGVILPVGLGLASGDPPTRMLVLGIIIAIVGVLLASVGSGSSDDPDVPARIAPGTLGLCVVAASGFGLIFVAMDAASGSSPVTALAATAGVRLGSFLSVLTACLASRTDPRVGVSRRDALSFAGIGMFDTGANLTFAVATALGELEIVALLGSLYPAVTSALAHVVLGEKLGRVQFVGVACVLAGVAILVTR